MDFKTKFDRAFSPWFTDKASYVELVGSNDGISTQYRAVRTARRDAMRFAERGYDNSEVASIAPNPLAQVLSEEQAWAPYGNPGFQYKAEMIIRVALPYHVFQDAIGRIIRKHHKDSRWLVRVIKRSSAANMYLSPEEMLPDTGSLSSKLMERLYAGNETRPGETAPRPTTPSSFNGDSSSFRVRGGEIFRE